MKKWLQVKALNFKNTIVISHFRKALIQFFFSMFPSMMRQGWHMLQALKCTWDLLLDKDFLL